MTLRLSCDPPRTGQPFPTSGTPIADSLDEIDRILEQAKKEETNG